MAGRVYVNTFGENDSKVFSTQENYHYQIMQALTERGYAKVQGGVLKGEEKWMGPGAASSSTPRSPRAAGPSSS